MSLGRLWIVMVFALVGVCGPSLSRADLAAEPQDLANRSMEAVRQGEWDMGIKYFKEAVARAPTEPTLIFNLALASDKGGRSLPANLHYRAYLALEPDGQNSARVRKRIAELDVKIESEALVLLRKGRELVDALPRRATSNGLDYEAISVREQLAKTFTRLGEYALAEEMIEAVINLSPESGLADYQYFFKALVQAGKDQEAYASLPRAAKHFVKNQFGTRAPVAYPGFDEAEVQKEIYIAGMLKVFAEGSLARGDIQGAKKYLAEAKEKNAYTGTHLPDMAERQAELGDIAGALATLAQVQAEMAGTRYAQALHRIGRVQAAKGDVQGALASIRQAEAIAAKSAHDFEKPDVYKELAVSYAAVGKIAEAIEARDAIKGSYPKTDQDTADIAIASALARAGAVAEARKRVDVMYASSEQSKAYRDIAYEQAKAGDIQGAESTILSIKDIQTVYEAKSRVAEARGKSREAHSLALQALVYDSDFKLYESHSEKGRQIKAEDPKAVARNFIDRASFSISALEDMRKTDAR